MLLGDLEAAKALQQRYGTLFDLLFTENNPIPVKTALSLMGLDHGAFRLPLCPMEEKNLLSLESCLRELSLII
jgi:4-hydroxy-tetrahydrodipicolinate synthase